MHMYNWYHSLLHSFCYIHRIDRLRPWLLPLLPLFPLFPFPLTWNPPSCDRIRPPLPWVARKLTPVFPSPAHLAPCPKSRLPGVSQTRNRHSLGRHCETNPYARLQLRPLTFSPPWHLDPFETSTVTFFPCDNLTCEHFVYKWMDCTSTLKMNILTHISGWTAPNLALGMVSQIELKSTQPMDQCAVCPNLT